jgi:hypothetical protein
MDRNGLPKSPINTLANGHSPAAASERLQIINDEKKFTLVFA